MNPQLRRFEGTGLGLPLTKRFIEKQGGSLRLASDVGRGTIATISIPLQQQRADAAD